MLKYMTPSIPLDIHNLPLSFSSTIDPDIKAYIIIVIQYWYDKDKDGSKAKHILTRLLSTTCDVITWITAMRWLFLLIFRHQWNSMIHEKMHPVQQSVSVFAYMYLVESIHKFMNFWSKLKCQWSTTRHAPPHEVISSECFLWTSMRNIIEYKSITYDSYSVNDWDCGHACHQNQLT